MVKPNEALQVIAETLSRSQSLPSNVTYLTHEADLEGRDASVKLPVIELQPISSVNLDDFNTDKVEVITENGTEIGRVYNSDYTLDVRLTIWSADGSRYDVDEMRNAVRDALYQHDLAGPGKTFMADLDNDGMAETVDSIWRFKIGDGERDDDLTTTPSTRRWRHTLTLWTYDQFNTSEDYITNVHYPSDYNIE